MQKSKSKLFPVLLSLCAVLLCGIAVIVYFAFVWERPSVGYKSVEFSIVYEDMRFDYEVQTDTEFVFDLLKEQNDALELAFEFESDAVFGAFITSLKNRPQDPANGLYYTYTLNGEFASGISSQTIKDGDHLIFELTQF